MTAGWWRWPSGCCTVSASRRCWPTSDCPRDRLLSGLVGFNLGVELGQLALVALFVPLAFLVRATAGYRRLALVGGSLAIAGLAALWFAERTLGVSFIS